MPVTTEWDLQRYGNASATVGMAETRGKHVTVDVGFNR